MEVTHKPIDWNLGEDMTYLVSNSEAANFLSCQRKHFYAHILNLEPKNASMSLSRGIIGHEALAEGYQVILDSSDQFLAWGKARKAVLNVIDRYFVAEFQKPSYPGKDKTLDMLNGLKILLDRYWTYAENDPWEILAVEKSYVMDLYDEYGYGMRLDLLIQYNAGPKNGEIWVVDHKFIYDFYDERTLTLNAQIPKYLATVRNDTGLVIKGGIMNMIRHRMKKGPMTDDELFRREIIIPSSVKTRNIMKEQIKVSNEIIKRHNMPVDEADENALRALNSMVCKNCSFFDLCMTQLEGNSGKLMIETEFQPNSYGYNNEVEGVV